MRKRIGECGVDSGMLMVGDPCCFVGREALINGKCFSWDQACREVFCTDPAPDRDEGMDVYDLGVAVATTDGDGCYPVFLEIVNGRRRLVVELD